MAGGPAPWKILQMPELIAILYEDFNHFRQVFLDGRALPKDPTPDGWDTASAIGNKICW